MIFRIQNYYIISHYSTAYVPMCIFIYKTRIVFTEPVIGSLSFFKLFLQVIEMAQVLSLDAFDDIVAHGGMT